MEIPLDQLGRKQFLDPPSRNTLRSYPAPFKYTSPLRVAQHINTADRQPLQQFATVCRTVTHFQRVQTPRVDDHVKGSVARPARDVRNPHVHRKAGRFRALAGHFHCLGHEIETRYLPTVPSKKNRIHAAAAAQIQRPAAFGPRRHDLLEKIAGRGVVPRQALWCGGFAIKTIKRLA